MEEVEKFRYGARTNKKCIYSVPAQETAKHCAKFGWLPLSDVAAVTKSKRISYGGHNYHHHHNSLLKYINAVLFQHLFNSQHSAAIQLTAIY